MRNANVIILMALLVAWSTGLAEASVAAFAGESHPPQPSFCSRATALPEQEWSSLRSAAKVAVQEANCPSVDVVALTGDALIDSLRSEVLSTRRLAALTSPRQRPSLPAITSLV